MCALLDITTHACANLPSVRRLGSSEANVNNVARGAGGPCAKDPVSRTRAMNGAVDDINALMDSETEVLNQAFDLLEQMGLKAVSRPSKAAAEDGEEEEEVEEGEEEGKKEA